VHTSLLQAQIAMMDFQAARYLVDGEVPPQAGNDHPYVTPMGVLETADGFINIGVGGEGQWRAFCKAIDRPDLPAAEEFATMEQRFRHRAKLMGLLADLFKTRRSADWLARLEEAGVPAGPIHKVDEVFADPQVAHLGIAVPLAHPARGDIRVVGEPVTLSRTPANIVSPLPEPGAHTDEVLREIGATDAEIARWRDAKVV
jgi:crotonobetainyl-CoA:carnitine CoA-transferase CaiB-like acyl-CoA transferase